MIRGAGAVSRDNLASAVRHGSRLQEFNEPDSPEQANLPVDQALALALWPQLMGTGLALGSPVTAEPADTSEWMIAFMDGNHRLTFVCVHWYDQRFEVARGVADLEAYLLFEPEAVITPVGRAYANPAENGHRRPGYARQG